MEPRIHALNNLEHAQWKVSFIRHLLQAHLASPWKGTRDWQAQHAEFLHRLAAAEDDVAICERALAVLHKIVEGEAESLTHKANLPHPTTSTSSVSGTTEAPVLTKPGSP